MSGFGLFSPFEMIRILTIMAELISHVMVLYSLTSTSSSTPVFVFSVLASSFPLLATWFRKPPTYIEDESSLLQVKMAEEQERMRKMAYSDSHRPEIILFGLGPWILQSWSQAKSSLLGFEHSQKMGTRTPTSFLLAHFDTYGLVSTFQNVRIHSQPSISNVTHPYCHYRSPLRCC